MGGLRQNERFNTMRILAHSKYDLGDHVDYKDGYPGRLSTDSYKEGAGVIRGTDFGKRHYYRPEIVVITYNIEPDQCIGFEHDDDVTVDESSILGRAS